MIVTSERAEQSTSRANRALAHFRAHRASGPMGVLRDPATVGDTAIYHAHDAIMRLVAIAEEFSIGRFVDAIEPLLPSDPIVSSLWEAELDRSGDTWHRRNALWKTYKSVNVATFPQHKELQAYIQARNAITHGLGGLTRRQVRRRTTTVTDLRHANIALRGNALLLSASDVEACAAVVKAFIAWLDATC